MTLIYASEAEALWEGGPDGYLFVGRWAEGQMRVIGLDTCQIDPAHGPVWMLHEVSRSARMAPWPAGVAPDEIDPVALLLELDL